tara:strand:- start:2249 stop:2785 length:537 start_codon:yes stop_codon:yes gene_type:complete
MILGLDISTSITGATIVDSKGSVLYNEAWDTRKFKNFFQKVKYVEERIAELHNNNFRIEKVYIEQSLQSFRSGFSSAKTLSTLARFNGVVSWLVYRILQVEPQFIAATSARKECGIKVPKGTKAKNVVIKYIIDNVPSVIITYTKHGNPRPDCYDRADSYVIARAGLNICQKEKRLQS